MSVIYCSKCGKKHEYNLAKPNFCSSCGTPLGATLPSKKTKQPKEEEDDDYEDDDEEDFDDDDGESYSNSRSVPNIRKLAVDVETAAVYNQFSLSSLVGSGPDKESSPSRKKRSRTLEDFKSNKSK